MTRTFCQNDRNGRKWPVLLKIQQTYIVFAKIDMTQHKNTSFPSCPRFFETIREVPAFSFKTVENFSNQTPDPRAKKVGRKSDPSGRESVRIPDGPRGIVKLEIYQYITNIEYYFIGSCKFFNRFSIKYRLTQRKYSCLVKREMYNKIFQK